MLPSSRGAPRRASAARVGGTRPDEAGKYGPLPWGMDAPADVKRPTQRSSLALVGFGNATARRTP